MKATVLAALALTPILLPAEEPAQIRRPSYAHLAGNSVEIFANGQLAGSGWKEASSGHIITAAHVVLGWEKLTLRTPADTVVEVKVGRVDMRHDLAILETEQPIDAPGIPLAKAMPEVGEDTFLFGSPMFRHGLMVKGSPARPTPGFEWNSRIRRPTEIYYFTAPSPIGTSGGVWVNDRGEAIGVQSAMMSTGAGSAGIAFVAGADAIRTLLEAGGEMPDPFIGVVAEELSEQHQEFQKSLPPGTGGVLAKLVIPDRRASEKLEPGDIITSFNGKVPRLREDYYRMVRATGDAEIRLEILRGGEELKLVLEAVQKPAE